MCECVCMGVCDSMMRVLKSLTGMHIKTYTFILHFIYCFVLQVRVKERKDRERERESERK